MSTIPLLFCLFVALLSPTLFSSKKLCHNGVKPASISTKVERCEWPEPMVDLLRRVENDETNLQTRIFCYFIILCPLRFYCRTCRRSWPSGRVTVLFRYRLRNGRGTVLMRPFGQDCRRCQEGFFDFPGFSERAVEEALLKLFSKIRKNCYGEDDGSDRGSTASDKVWTKPHEKALCEACQQGICDQDDDSEC
uniref:3CxxC-type domain-containing protein n=1 Tax=Nothobranchius furzeri TaxID=105023 RepID=A0A8C6LZR1_NOTFU